MSDLQQRVIAMVARELGLKTEDVKTDNNFIDDLNADSIDMVELCMTTEETFEREVPDADFEKIATVQDLIDLVERLGVTA